MPLCCLAAVIFLLDDFLGHYHVLVDGCVHSTSRKSLVKDTVGVMLQEEEVGDSNLVFHIT